MTTATGTATDADLAIAREFTNRVAERLGANLREVYLFGSRARGTPAPWSDYDLLVVVGRRNGEVLDTVHDVSFGLLLERGWDLSVKVYAEERFASGLRAAHPFLENVRREGIRLWSQSAPS